MLSDCDGPVLNDVVDIHTHAISPAMPRLEDRYPFDSWPSVRPIGNDEAEILVGGRYFRTIDSRSWSAARRLADMDQEGVAVQVLSPVPVTFCYRAPADGARELCRFQNQFLASLRDESAERFAALGAVPLQDTAAAIHELEYCVRSLGFLGVEVGSYVAGRELSDTSLEPFFAAAERLGALVFVHPAEFPDASRFTTPSLQFGAGMPCETATAAAKLALGGVFDRWPNVQICLAHAGGALPSILPRLDRGFDIFPQGTGSAVSPLDAAGRFMCDTLAYDPLCLQMSIARFGIDNVMVGSDYPFDARESPPGAILSHLERLGEESLDKIRRGNASRLFASVARSSR